MQLCIKNQELNDVLIFLLTVYFSDEDCMGFILVSSLDVCDSSTSLQYGDIIRMYTAYTVRGNSEKYIPEG